VSSSHDSGARLTDGPTTLLGQFEKTPSLPGVTSRDRHAVVRNRARSPLPTGLADPHRHVIIASCLAT
jgi:hypothetical protein